MADFLRNIDFNTIFDPDQDPDEKRAVRQNYRSLTKKIEGISYNVALFFWLYKRKTLEHQANPNDVTTDELLQQVHKADKLFSKGRSKLDSRMHFF